MRAALLARFPLPEWAIFFEVSSGTGSHARRRADAVAMNCFPSRGMEIHGVEVKHARSDWIRELKQPDKSTDVQQYCDRWWIAATPGVVKIEELPITWGLLELKDGKLRQVKAAPVLEAKPVSRTFMASVLRSAGKVDDLVVRKLVDAQVADARAQDQHWLESELARRRGKADEILKKVDEIREKTGIDLANWCPVEDIVKAMTFALSSGLGAKYNTLRNTATQMRSVSEQLLKSLDDVGYSDPTE